MKSPAEWPYPFDDDRNTNCVDSIIMSSGVLSGRKLYSEGTKHKMSEILTKSENNYVGLACANNIGTYTNSVETRGYIDNFRISKEVARLGFNKNKWNFLKSIRDFFVDIFYSVFGEDENVDR